MSDAINHYLCGKDLLDSGAIRFPVNERVLFLGCQGPDIFFYHNVLESAASKTNLGDKLHTEGINDFFYHGLQTCIDAPEEYKPVLRSYYLGLVCHHALDVRTHPFIFYRSGFYDKDDPSTWPWKHHHKRYEIQLDMAYYALRTGEKAYHFAVHRLFDIPQAPLDMITYFYQKTLSAAYGITLDGTVVQKSLNKAKKLTRVLSDPMGLKRLAVGFGEIIVGDPGMFSTAFYGVKPWNPTLVLNLNKDVWRHPCDEESTYTDSYPDLCHLTQIDLQSKMTLLDPILLEKIPLAREVVDSCFQDLGYDTGLDWKTGPCMRYFEPILF